MVVVGIFILSLSILLSPILCKQIYWEQRLTNYLTNDIEDYNPNVGPWTPVANSNISTTKILTQLEIFGIRSVDLDTSSVTFTAAFRQWWNDTRLTWDPKQFGGIEYVYLKADGAAPLAWISDLIIREDAGEGLLSNFKFIDQRCKYTGECYFSRIGFLSLQMTFDLSNYPYDVQTAKATIESWIHQASRIEVGLKNPPMIVMEKQSYGLSNIEWEICGNNSQETVMDFGPQFGQYTRVEFEIQIKRQGSTMLVAILIPGAIITFLGLQFTYLPRGSGERINFLATILLTEVMFLVMISSSLPLSKFIPRLAWLFLAYTILLTVLLFCAIIVDKFHQMYEDYKQSMTKTKKKHENIKKNLMSFFKQKLSKSPFSATSLPSLKLHADYASNSFVKMLQSTTENGNFDMEAQQQQIQQESEPQQDIAQANPKLGKLQNKTQELKKKMQKYKRFIKILDLSVYTFSMIAFIIVTSIQFSLLF